MSVFRDLLMAIGEPPTPTPTLRHIQVGDILKDKTLYFDFPDDFYTNSYFNSIEAFSNYICASQNENQVSPIGGNFSNDYSLLWARKVKSTNNFLIYVGDFNSAIQSVYAYVSGITTKNLTEFNLSDYSNINNNFATEIKWIDTNNPMYDHIWIEDE